ncbi:class I SAM-dependent methyltransferase [Paenibacillus kobensis]|uniref:class I SAM-dependent methyltransferase n=1 Tax=Paenibacillus kobensis TaxID=59841 RepID=UPI000FD9E27E|nr:class I SAM-dependent methyltransferase [Paenibacillus kobensis]
MGSSSHLFTKEYHLAFEYVERYTANAILRSLSREGITFDRPLDAQAVIRKVEGLTWAEPIIQWALEFLVQKGALSYWGGEYSLKQIEEVSFTPNSINIGSSLAVIDVVEASWGDILRGRTNILRLLMPNEGRSMWEAYFSNEHGLYSVHNQWLAEFLSSVIGVNDKVLELGAGYGSAAIAAMDKTTKKCAFSGQVYLTDRSPSLARLAAKELHKRFPTINIESGKLDIDAQWQDDGQRYDVIYAVNVLHCAKDVRQALSDIRQRLTHSGVLILSECVRSEIGRYMHQEFIFSLIPGFNILQNTAGQPTGFGFLTPQDWDAAMRAAGFNDVQVVINDGNAMRGALISGVNQ